MLYFDQEPGAQRRGGGHGSIESSGQVFSARPRDIQLGQLNVPAALKLPFGDKETTKQH